jgi:hypothetical protein
MRMALLVCLFATLPAIAAASPPPPPPEYMQVTASALAARLTPDSFSTYAAKFADDVDVSVNGGEIASGKAAWLSLERARIGKSLRHVIAYSVGGNTIMVLDEFDDMLDCPIGMGCDPRYITRAALYKIGTDHLIHEVRFLQGGSFLIAATGPD